MMQPQPQLKIQSAEWNNKARYRVRDTVVYNSSYWINTTGVNSEPVDGGSNWITLGSVSPITGGTMDNKDKLITVSGDDTGLQDDDLIGANYISALVSSAYGTLMNSDLTFNSATGTIEDLPVTIGQQYLVFYNKS